MAATATAVAEAAVAAAAAGGRAGRPAPDAAVSSDAPPCAAPPALST